MSRESVKKIYLTCSPNIVGIADVTSLPSWSRGKSYWYSPNRRLRCNTLKIYARMFAEKWYFKESGYSGCFFSHGKWNENRNPCLRFILWTDLNDISSEKVKKSICYYQGLLAIQFLIFRTWRFRKAYEFIQNC